MAGTERFDAPEIDGEPEVTKKCLARLLNDLLATEKVAEEVRKAHLNAKTAFENAVEQYRKQNRYASNYILIPMADGHWVVEASGNSSVATKAM